VPIVNGRGESSENTELKEEHLEVIFQTWVPIGKAILHRYNTYAYRTFFYLDLNAGSGLYPEIPDKHNSSQPLRGSPLLFLDAARKCSLTCEVILCEKNKISSTQLYQNISSRYPDAYSDMNGDHDWGHRYYAGRNSLVQPMVSMKDSPIRTHLISANYNDIFDQFLGRLMDVQGNRPELCQPYGIVYSDENGTKQPWDFFRELALYYPKMDILIHMGATSHKRSLGSPYVPRVDQQINDLIRSINKKYWIVREPYTSQQWTFLFGTNWYAMPRFQKQEFYPHQSAKGQEILHRISVILHQEAQEFAKNTEENMP
jgi:hypothetical protein